MLQKAQDPLDIRNGLFSDPDLDDDEGSAEDLSSLGMQVRKSGKLTPVYKQPGT